MSLIQEEYQSTLSVFCINVMWRVVDFPVGRAVPRRKERGVEACGGLVTSGRGRPFAGSSRAMMSPTSRRAVTCLSMNIPESNLESREALGISEQCLSGQ